MSHPGTHFVQRWRERGDPSIDGWAVQDRLFRGITETEDVMMHKGMMLKRFLVNDVPYYTVFHDDGWPMTVLTQGMLRKIKKARKFKKKMRSHNGRLRQR